MRYSVEGWRGIAFFINRDLGDEVEVIMVGDDRKHIVDRADLTPLDEGEFCDCCGQIGCGWGSTA